MQDGAELALGFNDPGPDLPEEELDLAVTVTQDTLRALYLQCAIGATPAFPPARLRWELWNGTGWTALNVLKDETLAFTRSGHLVLKLPPKGVAKKTKLSADATHRPLLGARAGGEKPVRACPRAPGDPHQYRRRRAGGNHP